MRDEGWRERVSGGLYGAKNMRPRPKTTKLTIETLQMIKIRPSYRGDELKDDFKSPEECGPSFEERTPRRPYYDKPTTKASTASEMTKKRSTSTATNPDVVSPDQSSSRVRRMESKLKIGTLNAGIFY